MCYILLTSANKTFVVHIVVVIQTLISLHGNTKDSRCKLETSFDTQDVYKLLLDEVFVIPGIIKVEGRASADNTYLDLKIIPDITKPNLIIVLLYVVLEKKRQTHC